MTCCDLGVAGAEDAAGQCYGASIVFYTVGSAE